MAAPSLSLEGKLAFVTGARRGLGKEIALLFADSGADVAICDFVSNEELDKVATSIEKLGRRTLATQVDVRNKNSIENATKKVISEIGAIDILVNVAGVINRELAINLPEEEWDKVIDTNLKGCYLFSQVVVKEMVKNKKGCIINIGSDDGYVPIPNQLAYCCSKVGVRMLTAVMAVELATHNIRINSIAPGTLNAPMSESVRTDPATLKATLDGIAMGRLGEPNEIANVALFLASDLASYVNGASWSVDGAEHIAI